MNSTIKQNLLFYIYIIYNTINGKMYVGFTHDLHKRWLRHKSTAKSTSPSKKKYPIHKAIAKYGATNFIFKKIEDLPDLETAANREKEWIKTLKEVGYKLYNVTEGGEGVLGIKWSDEAKKEMSKRFSGEGNPMYGVRLFGEANGNYGKAMKPYVKETLLTYRTKLSNEDVQAIIDKYNSGIHTQAELAREFNVSATQIHQIVKRGVRTGSKKLDPLIKSHLSKERVSEIRTLFSSGQCLQKDLAIKFNIHPDHINAIINNRSWYDPNYDTSYLKRIKKLNNANSIKIMDQNGKIYPSISQASKSTGISQGEINKILKGKISKCKSYTFSYIEE